MAAGLSSGCLRTVELKVPSVHGRIQPRNGGCPFGRDLNLIPKVQVKNTRCHGAHLQCLHFPRLSVSLQGHEGVGWGSTACIWTLNRVFTLNKWDR